MPPIPLRVADLVKHFGSLTALDGVSLDLSESEILGLLGPNGAGKTTFVRAIRAALVLTFVLPIAFFSIFAGIFGSRGDSRTPRIRLIVVDEDRSERSAALVAALQKEPALNVMKVAARKGGACHRL